MLSVTLFMHAFVQYGSVANGSDRRRPHAWPRKSKQGMLGVEEEVDEEQKEAYNDAGPMGRLPGQQRGANGNH